MCLKNLARNKMIIFIFDICHYVGENRSELLVFKHHNDRKNASLCIKKQLAM